LIPNNTAASPQHLPVGSACSLVRNISIGLITLADSVLARLPAIRGAGVSDGADEDLEEDWGRLIDEMCAEGSVDETK
jgi:hypothetical protein